MFPYKGHRVIQAILLTLLPLCFACAAAAASTQARVSVFTPQNTVKKVRQVAVRFSESIVPFGDPTLKDPFDIECPEKGVGRWADTNNWVYDFEHDLPAGVSCTFTLKPGLKTTGGTEVDGTRVFRFNTGGPSIMASLPREGNSSIDANQVFILVLDAPVKTDTVAKHMYCEAQGVGERIPGQLIDGAERQKILSEQQSTELPGILFRKRGNRWSVNTIRDRSEAADANVRRAIAERVVIVRCARRFPDEADIKIVWDAGIQTLTGIATTELQTLAYTTRPAFTARFSCERMNAKAGCIPILPMTVKLSGEVPTELAMKIRLRDMRGKTYTPAKSQDKDNVVSSVQFNGPFPEKAKFILEMPGDLRDDAGRSLANANGFPLKVATDAYPPIAKFPADFGILESKTGAALPITLRNVEAGKQANKAHIAGSVMSSTSDEDVIRWLTRFEEAKASRSKDVNGKIVYESAGARSIFAATDQTKQFVVPKPLGEKAFEVVGIPLTQSGYHVVEVASPRLGAALLEKNQPFYARTNVLVTNLSAHVKVGRESSVVWVTSLDQARPVSNAHIAIRDCNGALIAEGDTDLNGIAKLPGIAREAAYCQHWPGGYFVSAHTADDMTFTLTSWSRGIEPWEFKVPYSWSKPEDPIHGVFDRTLFRAGETVHMKLIARRRTLHGFDLMPPESLPKRIAVEHPGSGMRRELSVNFDARGIALVDWTIPKEAKLGEYSVTAEAKDKNAGTIIVGDFRVEEFRLPTMRAQIAGPAKSLVSPKEVPLDVMVSYLAGGGAGGLPVKLRTQLEPASVQFDDYSDFGFYGPAVKEGIQRDKQGSSWEYNRSGSDEETSEEEADQSSQITENRVAETIPLTLDRAGTVHHVLKKLPAITTPQSIVAEVEYNDPNGERLTAANRIPLYPAALHVGLRTDSWAASKDRVRIQAIALDLAGKPMPNRQVKVDMFKVQRYSHRKRLIGGFYAYENVEETKRLGEVCNGKTDDKGRLHCDFDPKTSGEVVLQASAKDDAGNTTNTTTSIWVAGKGEWWFAVSDNDRMDVIPESKRYEAGQKIRLQVRMPFREATALVTVEREGIIDSYVMPLSGKSPVVEIPVKDEYGPNVFVSVLAVRGRVEGVKPTALVDLGKPAFKLGIAEVKVGWQPHELKVNVATKQQTYKVRDKVPVTVSVTRANGEKLPAGTDIAFAAVDEALLELKPNDSWKLLDVMMQNRSLEVVTSTAQMQVVGRRHFGRKALPPGGGGGRQNARELFDTLLLWKGSVPLDAKGEASFEVPLNDSFSSFKLTAIATGGVGLFGTGSTAVRTTQDIMLFGGLPPVVREGDAYRVFFVARNTTNQKIPLKLGAALTPIGADGKAGTKRIQLPELDATLDASESRELGWDVKAPFDIANLQWEVKASNDKGQVIDHLKLTQKVIPAYPVQVYQSTLFQLDAPKSFDVQRPADAIPNRGGISVALQSRLSDDLAGVREYMSRYPYSCLEQRSSIAVALRDERAWRSVMAGLSSYLDRDGLAKYFPSEWSEGSDVLTSYVLAIANESDWEIPEDARARMLKGLNGFVTGRVIRHSQLPTADLTLRKLTAIEALSRYDAADAKMLSSITIAPNLWPTSAVLDWFNILKRVQDIPKHDAYLAEAKQILRSRLNFQGTIMTFSSERSDALWWLMISPDLNANRAVLALMSEIDWVPDMPRMARGAMERRQRGHWNTTVANAWGVLAMNKFGKAFEAEPVSGTTEADLDRHQAKQNWTQEKDRGTMNFAWPNGKEKLSLKHEGTGKPWVTMTSHAALPLKNMLSTGYRIERRVTPIEQKVPGSWSRGDVMRVSLTMEAQSDMTWVVVNDPIPAGASIVGSGLGRDSQLLGKGEKRTGYAWAAFEERRFDGFRAYYDYVPKGKWTVEYTIRLNNPGMFLLPSTRVEAMYAPEMFGELPNGTITVK